MPRYKGGGKARDYDLFRGKGHVAFDWITPQLKKATGISDQTLKSEYTRLRDIAQKRLKRMAGSKLAQETYQQHAGGFPKLAELQGRGEIVNALSDVSNFLVARRGSLSGIKEVNKDIVKTLASKGVHVKTKNIADYGLFMNTMKKALGISEKDTYGSAMVTAAWDDLMANGKITSKEIQKAIDKIQGTKAAAYQIEQKAIKGIKLF